MISSVYVFLETPPSLPMKTKGLFRDRIVLAGFTMSHQMFTLIESDPSAALALPSSKAVARASTWSMVSNRS